MKKWKSDWKEMLLYERTFLVACITFFGIAAVVLLQEIFGKIGVSLAAVDIIFDGLFVAGSACGAVAYWRRNRHDAKAFLIAVVLSSLHMVWDIVKLFI